MTSRFVPPFYDVGSGITPASGAQLFFFATGTSTPKDTYTTSAGAAGPSNDNPVDANAKGVFPDIFISGSYKVVLKNKKGVQEWEADPVVEYAAGNFEENLINDLSQAYDFDTVADAVASTIAFPIGKRIVIKDYATGNNSGILFFRVVAAGTGTADGGKYINLPLTSLQLDQNLATPYSVKAWGAVGDYDGASGTDDSTAIQACFDYVESILVKNGYAYFPNAGYFVSTQIQSNNISIDFEGSIVAADGDFSIWRIIGNNQTFKDARIQYVGADIAQTNRLAIQLTDGVLQASKNTYINIVTRNAYQGWYNNGGSGANGSIFGSKWINCRADLSTDWGWYLDCAIGTTTLNFDTCQAKGSLIAGQKGFFINDSSEVILTNCASDAFINGNALVVNNTVTVYWDVFTIESCELSADLEFMVGINGGRLEFGTLSNKVGSYNMGNGNTGYLLQIGSTTLTADYGEIIEHVTQPTSPSDTNKATTITSAAGVATATITAHSWANGDRVLISGANESNYNGEHIISNVTVNTLDFTVATTVASPATGTILTSRTVSGTLKKIRTNNATINRSDKVSISDVDTQGWNELYGDNSNIVASSTVNPTGVFANNKRIYKVNNISMNTSVGTGEPIGWVCTVESNFGEDSGTWESFGPISSAGTYTTTNVTVDRTYDADLVTTAELADVLGTLISDLQGSGIIK